MPWLRQGLYVMLFIVVDKLLGLIVITWPTVCAEAYVENAIRTTVLWLGCHLKGNVRS